MLSCIFALFFLLFCSYQLHAIQPIELSPLNSVNGEVNGYHEHDDVVLGTSLPASPPPKTTPLRMPEDFLEDEAPPPLLLPPSGGAEEPETPTRVLPHSPQHRSSKLVPASASPARVSGSAARESASMPRTRARPIATSVGGNLEEAESTSLLRGQSAPRRPVSGSSTISSLLEAFGHVDDSRHRPDISSAKKPFFLSTAGVFTLADKNEPFPEYRNRRRTNSTTSRASSHHSSGSLSSTAGAAAAAAAAAPSSASQQLRAPTDSSSTVTSPALSGVGSPPLPLEDVDAAIHAAASAIGQRFSRPFEL